MKFRLETQLAEAFGTVNRYYCSKFHKREIEDLDTILTYFIKSGGAADFDTRFEFAMSDENRWYCSQYYNRPITDPEILWYYYTKHCRNTSAEQSNIPELCAR